MYNVISDVSQTVDLLREQSIIQNTHEWGFF